MAEDEIDAELRRTVERVRRIRRARLRAIVISTAIAVVTLVVVAVIVGMLTPPGRFGGRITAAAAAFCAGGLGFLVYRRLDPKESEEDD